MNGVEYNAMVVVNICALKGVDNSSLGYDNNGLDCVYPIFCNVFKPTDIIQSSTHLHIIYLVPCGPYVWGFRIDMDLMYSSIDLY